MPVQVPLETAGGLVCALRPEDVPEGASPRNYDVDFIAGGRWYQRGGLNSVYSFEDAETGPNPGTGAATVSTVGNPWGNPTAILSNGSTYATAANLLNGSDALQVTQFTFDLPDTVAVTGISVDLKGYSNSNVQVTLQLLKAGVPVGTSKTVTLLSSDETLTLGGPTDAWGGAFLFSDVNSEGFGVQITAVSTFSLAAAFLNYITMTVHQTAGLSNFNYITTFEAQDGTVYNVALDADGSWWLENVTTTPGELSLIMEGLTPKSFSSSAAADAGLFTAFSNLLTGSDLPRKYVPALGGVAATQDRISQVGPGAAPIFTASTNATGQPAAITAYSVATNVVTLTAANQYVAGTALLFSDLTVATFLNGKTLVVLGSGLSPTQFQVQFTHSDVSTTPDTGLATPQQNYPISTITQPPVANAPNPLNFATWLQSAGPGNTSPGNVVTVYYAGTQSGGPFANGDPDLLAAFNSGLAPVYLYLTYTDPYNAGSNQGPMVVQVTSVGVATPPNQPSEPFNYFTFVTTTAVQYLELQGSGHPLDVIRYQRTEATMTLAEPVPGIGVGSSVSIAATSVAAYNTTWPLTKSLNSGAMQISQTSLTAGVGLYSYNVSTGIPPVPGQLVTITGTLNANGQLNGVDLVIATVSGANSGTFTVNGLEATVNYPAAPEQGQATTAGTQFTFDPGADQVGNVPPQSNPIFGNATGGYLIFANNGQFIGAGTRQGVVGFITRNGYYTAPSPPVIFNIPENTAAILASQIPIGPPNVIARYISFTEAGQNGVPGANFYVIKDPVLYTVEDVQFTASSLIIRDNTTTAGVFSFPDSTLLQSTAIDVQGNDLFNLEEIGEPAWIVRYASRNMYGLCRNKLQNFLNLSFDGGYLPATTLTPLGWTVPDTFGALRVSPIFGNSYYIQNATASTLATAGMITQGAYQDAYLVPILNINVAYSVRLAARIPSSDTTGNLAVDLVANGISYGSFTLPFASMTSTMAIFSGTLLTLPFATVPAGLTLRVYATGIGVGADVEVDRLEIFPTVQPVLTNLIATSYANNSESVDSNTGYPDTSDENTQPCYGAAVVLDQLFLLKERSMYSTQDAPNYEPGGDPGWGIHEVSQQVGTCGVNAFDYGDEWLLTLCRSGVYGFNGGRPEPVSRELQIQNGGLWEAIDWSQANSFWLKNDIINRRFYVGVALPTPNFWLPKAPASKPIGPNVILMCNYEGSPTFDEMISAAPVHTTMFGDVKALDMKRKWSIWQIPAPYAALVKQTTGEALTLLFCNGIASGKIYEMVQQKGDDDGVTVYPLYTTYGFVTAKQGQQLQLGAGRKLATGWTGNVSGNGYGGLRLYPNTLGATYPQTNALALKLTDPAQDDDERKVEVSGQRIFVEITGQGDGQGGPGYIECGRMTLKMAPHPWSTERGIAHT